VKNVEQLKARMIELLNNPEKRKALAKNARPSIIEKYDQQKVWEAIAFEYEKRRVN
jgi:glycosyltransferase involved in cell wall biosynthesis